jgi:uncharacterized membrane protein
MNPNEPIDKAISKWQAAGVITADTAARIRSFESQQASMERLRWPVLVALGLGGVAVCAGVLLFVAAHWDQLSPGSRFTVVLALTALFPIAGAFIASRFPALATTLYAIGTISTGAGIFMAAQIFNLEEHYPNGILLWGVAALLGWLLLREWPQAAILALLVPAWLACEWVVRTDHYAHVGQPMVGGLLLLAIAYFTADREAGDTTTRKALVWIGGLMILPLVVAVVVSGDTHSYPTSQPALPAVWQVIGWVIAIALPLIVAFYLRGRAVWLNGLAAAWIVILSLLCRGYRVEHSPAVYLWLTIGALGGVAWGVFERCKERVNLGIVGFAITVIAFYFSTVADMLGRSAGLLGLGLLLIGGGWAMERTRRRLVARIAGDGR